jgi:hypothetical protein
MIRHALIRISRTLMPATASTMPTGTPRDSKHHALLDVEFHHGLECFRTKEVVRHGFRGVSPFPEQAGHGFSFRGFEFLHMGEGVFSHESLASREGGAEIGPFLSANTPLREDTGGGGRFP